MTKYLADTTVLVEHLRGNPIAKNFLEKEEPYISTVTVAELIQGSKDKNELASVLKICGRFHEITIDKKVSSKATGILKNYCLSNGLLFLDALIAATALENNITLVTENVKHFKFIPGLKLIPQTKALEL